MYLTENIKIALEGIKSNKMRSLLTMIGIIIGIGSVIGIVTVGNSMSASVSSSLQSLGAASIMINVQQRESEQDMFAYLSESDLISDEMIDTYREVYSTDIEAISLLGFKNINGKVKDGPLYANVTVSGVNEEYNKVNNVKIINGRFIRESDVKSNRFAAVVSDKLVRNMFDAQQNPLGQEIMVNLDDSVQTFTIVGVYKYEQKMMMNNTITSEEDIRTYLYVPITTFKKIAYEYDGYDYIVAMAGSNTNLEKFVKATESFFNTYYKNNVKYQVRAVSMESMVSSFTNMMGKISIAVATIAGISLIVGGVGVMNIMLVSVTERTREIGTRKALGAKNAHIRIQFVVEAMIICAIGGLLGTVFGACIGYLGSLLLGKPMFPQVTIIFISVLFSMLIGVFFGYYPANKAAMLDPIEALRYE